MKVVVELVFEQVNPLLLKWMKMNNSQYIEDAHETADLIYFLILKTLIKFY